jgi:transcriptional regulator with XRE-family HTH domain
MESLGKRVKRLREARGLRQVVLGGAVDVSLQTVRKLENDQGGIRAERVPTLARFLQVSADYLLGMDDPSLYPEQEQYAHHSGD